MPDDFPQEVKWFINQHIESLAELEVLLYIRQHRDRQIHPHEVANRMALTSEMANSIMANLVRVGFAAKKESCFQYQANETASDELIGKLADIYRDRRLAVTNEIYSKPLTKVKTFADAFRFRKES